MAETIITIELGVTPPSDSRFLSPDEWGNLERLAQQKGLLLDEGLLIDAETLVASYHPLGDTAVIAALGRRYGPWSEERQAVAISLASGYREAINVIPEDTPGQISVGNPEQQLAISPQAAANVSPTPQPGSEMPTATDVSKIDVTPIQKTSFVIDAAFVKYSREQLTQGEKLTVEELHEKTVALLSSMLGIEKGAVKQALDVQPTKKLDRSDMSVLSKIRNAIGFEQMNKPRAGSKHIGIIREIRDITHDHEVNVLLGKLLGYYLVTKGKGEQAQRTIHQRAPQTASTAIHGYNSASERINHRKLLQGLTVIGLFAQARRDHETEN